MLTESGDQSRKGDKVYIRRLFDALAPNFERKLVQGLEYSAPWKLRDLVVDFLVNTDLRWPCHVVDLGCGSGLCAKAFAETPCCGREASCGSRWIGVDLSPKMLELASSLNLYDSLNCEDVVCALESMSADRSVDMVIAADTFIYVGDLVDVFRATSQTLIHKGIFVFSTEELSEDCAQELKLLKSARFAHSHRYICELSSRFGFIIQRHCSGILRKEQGEIITGHFYVLQLGCDKP